jgi:hypothetical protein
VDTLQFLCSGIFFSTAAISVQSRRDLHEFNSGISFTAAVEFKTSLLLLLPKGGL